MNWLADSNILTTLSKSQSPQFNRIRLALSNLHDRGDVICIIPQNLIEYWAVATRPIDANGLGLDVAETYDEVRKFKQYFHFLVIGHEVYSNWEKLVTKYQVKGKKTHDAHIVAAMIQHHITHLLTLMERILSGLMK